MSRKRIKNFVYASYFPFVLYGIIICLIHLDINLQWGDDIFFANAIQNNLSLTEWQNYLSLRYEQWTSRLLIEIVLILMAKFPVIWRILDIIAMLWIGVSFSIFFNSEKKMEINWFIVFAILCFPFETMNSAGWIATTLNYLWPFAAGMVACIPIYNKIKKQSTSIGLYIISLIAILFASNQEQMCAIMLAICSFFIIYIFFRDKKISRYLFIELIISFVSFIYILQCPGNSLRKISEVSKWFPEYDQLSFLRKLEMGYSSSLYEFIMKSNLVFVLFCLVLVFLVVYNNKKIKYIIFSSVPLVATLIFGLFSNITELILPHLVELNTKMTKIGTGIQLANVSSWIPDFIITFVFICIIISLWVGFNDKRIACLSIFLVLLGLASRWIMGFSPTIWDSGLRTFLFMYFSYIVVAILIFNNLIIKKVKDVKLYIAIGILFIFLIEHLIYYVVTF